MAISQPTADGKLIAVGRSNNSIEIWVKETWAQLMVIPGNAGAPIRRIHWVEVDEPTSNNTGDQSNLLYTEAG